MVEVGERLKKARQQAKQTLRVAAVEIGCSYQSLSNWERKSAVPHPLWAPKIQRYLRRYLGRAA